jgi:hypothetical protein
MPNEPQNLSNHSRIDPLPLLHLRGPTINLLWCIRHLIAPAPGRRGVVMAVIADPGPQARTFPLKAQDRVIRLEERLRCERLLPKDLVARLDELRIGQWVALRFASDGELEGLVRAALDEKLGGKAIKQRIKVWRPDHDRV